MRSLNFIEPSSIVMGNSTPDISLLIMTLLVSFSAVGYGFTYLSKQITTVQETKQDTSDSLDIDKTVYQSWSGTFADGQNSLLVTIVRQKFGSKKENDEWVDWDGSNDSSTITRNFYIGNTNPLFNWTIETRDFDVKATVCETMIDGWDSVVLMKITTFMNPSYQTSTQMNSFLKIQMEENRIEWQKNLIELDEYQSIFQ